MQQNKHKTASANKKKRRHSFIADYYTSFLYGTFTRDNVPDVWPCVPLFDRRNRLKRKSKFTRFRHSQTSDRLQLQ